MKVAVFVGTRPEVIKMAPIIWEILNRKDMELLFIHTGQHYSPRMFDMFIKDLNLPEPHFSLIVGSGSHAQQTGKIMIRTEKILISEKPDIVLVEGDTNSAVGVALAASKLGILVGHVEAGCRSFNRNMPEELNRTVIADLATYHFAPTKTAYRNLINEGIHDKSIFLTGHPIVDLLSSIMKKVDASTITKRLRVKKKEFVLLTVHRAENVDNQSKLRTILNALSRIAKLMPVVFPIHPRTVNRIKQYGFQEIISNFICTRPLSYFDALNLIKNSSFVVTDSGGIQQEAALLRSPCITLRESTEWPETVKAKVNFLTGTDEEKIFSTSIQIQNLNPELMNNRFNKIRTVFGRPPVSSRIVNIIRSTRLK